MHGHWLKNILGGGSGGPGNGGNANILIVHATEDDSIPESDPVITLDKTYSEINAAVSENDMVFVDVGGGMMLSYVSKIPAFGDLPATLFFSAAFTPNGTQLFCETLTLDENNGASLLGYPSD